MSRFSLAQLRQFALFWAVLVYALLDLLLDDALADGSTSGSKALQVVLSSISLLVLLSLGQFAAVKIWGRHLLKTWVYVSSSGNYGLATFSIAQGNVVYRVDLYRDAEDVLAALDLEPGYAGRCLGHATSNAVTYKDDRVDLIYEVENSRSDYAQREGILSLQLLHKGSGMKGYWRSSSETGEARRGELNFMTVADFRAVQAAA